MLGQPIVMNMMLILPVQSTFLYISASWLL